MNVSDEIRAIYGKLPHYPSEPRLPAIEPYIGADYSTPSPDRLRIAVVGINSYIDAEDLPAQPGWFAAWVGQEKYPFYRGLARDAEALGQGIRELLGEPGLRFDLETGLYVTNAIKRYLPRDNGRHASSVESEWFDEGRDVWKQELRALARAGALPHVIIVLGKPSWKPVYAPLQELCADPGESVFSAYRPMSVGSEHYHHLNVIELTGRSGRGRLLLLRLDHPSNSRTRTAAKMLESEEFRQAVKGLGRSEG